MLDLAFGAAAVSAVALVVAAATASQTQAQSASLAGSGTEGEPRCPRGEISWQGRWVTEDSLGERQVPPADPRTYREFERATRSLRPSLAASSVVATNSGWLAACDVGEWGGGVLHFDRQGKPLKVPMNTDLPVTHLIRLNASVIAIRALMHLGVDWGGISQLSEHGTGKWSAEREIRLSGAPYYPRLYLGNILIVSLNYVPRNPGNADEGPSLFPNETIEAFSMGKDGKLVRLGCR